MHERKCEEVGKRKTNLVANRNSEQEKNIGKENGNIVEHH